MPPTQSTDRPDGVLVPDWLARRAGDMPDRPAILMGAAACTFADLFRWAHAAADRLAAHGVAPGDRVAVLARNGPPLVATIHALSQLGAVLIPLNTRLAPAELAWQIEDAGIGMVLHDHRNDALARELVAARLGVAALQLEVVASPPDADSARPPLHPAEGAGRSVSPDEGRWRTLAPSEPPQVPARDHPGRLPRDTSRIGLARVQCAIYTSGTTGRPKAVALTFGNHWWSAVGSALNLGLRDDDRWLLCLPLFHVGGLTIVWRSAIYGTAIVFPDPPDASFDPVQINRTIDESRATIISVVGIQLARMLESGLGDRHGASLRCVLLGGGPAPRPLLERCAAGGIPVIQSYGLTEACSQVATLAPADALRKLGSAGRPLLPTELRIEPAGEERTLDGFVVGEILVRGPTVTPGYLAGNGDDAMRSPRDPDRWLWTGDIGYLDSEGYLYVLDRRADLIISGGENVYPAEVEAVLLRHPAVLEAGVYGEPDPVWGQRVVAAVVPRGEHALDEEALRAFCRDHLAAYKVPSTFRTVEILPRNASGKLLRRLLREP